MKRMGMVLLLLCLAAVLLPVCAGAEVSGTMRGNVQVSTGPGDQYELMDGMYLSRGEAVTVRTKFSSGKETWLQVEFVEAGALVRGYVRSAEVSASTSRVPTEAPLCAAVVTNADVPVGTGPLNQGYLMYEGSIRQDSSALVYEVAAGYAHIEFWNYDTVRKSRAWVPLNALETEMSFNLWGYYGVAEEDISLCVPSPTKAPSTYYGSVEAGYPVGKMCTVVSGSCHVRKEPDADSPTVNYAYVGERYKVLECRTGYTGKDWYRIKIDGAYGWISSGLVSLD